MTTASENELSALAAWKDKLPKIYMQVMGGTAPCSLTN